ncbi:coiled-coil domain-containing protein 84 [Limosa lapponica baueri]|uniref:Coiled-coil domain-containing protein 84 n=1 Tax=Limosa lapponica baueri TaxID=1758121 RepID=A0A2I0TZM2_LIMLA|nr:coiled-coil domain-containing protein 84 [Limosa lapponica baueri]
MALPQAGLLRHLAGEEARPRRAPGTGPDHRRETARFWREQRVEAALRERVLVPAEEYERFARGLELALDEHRRREEEHIQQMAAGIREAERRQRETVRDALQHQTELEPGTGPPLGSPSTAPGRDASQDAEQPGPSGTQTGPDLNWMESGQALTFIGHQETEGKGNVHTEEKQKLKKLPAERVGANFDHTCQTGESWLPSFGRVWNHGRRWQSR